MAARLVSHTSAAGTAHTNSTDEASLGRHTFRPGDLTPGKIYQLIATARATATNSTDTATMRVRWGTSSTASSNTAVGASAAVDVADNDVAMVVGFLQCQSPTRAVFSGFLTDCDAAASKLVGSGVTVLAIDQEATYYMDFTADWSAASASDSIQAESFSVIELT